MPLGQHFRIRVNQRLVLMFGAALFAVLGCTRDNLEDLNSGYPEEIALILRKTCATTSCHSSQNSPDAAGLNLETWSDLFKGDRGGSPVIPYWPDKSFLLYSINSDTNWGPVLEPTMPLNQEALTKSEYDMLWQWINTGARNAEGEEAFPAQAGRRKWYVGHNDCDQVAVLDAESRQIMAYVDVGIHPDEVEQIYDIKVAPNGEDWFLVFANTNDFIQRYNSLTDEKVADITLGDYYWNNMTFSPDSRFAFVASEYWRKVAVVDLSQNALVGPATSFPIGVTAPVVHPLRQELYMVKYRRQDLYVVDYDDDGALTNRREVDLVQHIPAAAGAALLPQEILFLPDGSKYFVTCWNSNEVRVLDGATNALLDVILMPDHPGKMSYSASAGRLFVSCENDLVSWAGAFLRRGSVIAINAMNHQIEGTIYAGYQPHGMIVDEVSGLLVVANRNIEPGGPAAHHASSCGDRNGYVSLIDVHSLELVPDYKYEVLADPFAISGKW